MTEGVDDLLVVKNMVCCDQRSNDLVRIRIPSWFKGLHFHYLCDIHHDVECCSGYECEVCQRQRGLPLLCLDTE